MNDKNQRKSGAILSYVSIIASILVQLLYTPFLIRMLGQSEYGLYSLIASVISYLTVLDLGFGNALVVYTVKYRARNDIESEKKMQGMFKIIFYIIGLVIALISAILYFNVNTLFGKTMTNNELDEAKIMMIILALNLIITFSFNIYSSIINAYEKFTFQKVMSILNTLMKPIAMTPLLFLGYKSIAMCLAITIINIIIVVSNYFYCRKKLNVKVKYCGFDWKLFKIIFSYSIWIFVGTIVDKVNWSVDQFILGAVAGTVAVSLYSVASQFNTLFLNLSGAINGVMLPKISKMVAIDASNEEISNEFIKVGRIQYLLIFFMASGFTLFGKEFIVSWVGNEYVMSFYIALLLILPLCIPLIQNIGISIMQAKNLHRFRSILYTFIAIANLAISIPLAKKFGGIGSAIGTGMSLIVGNGIIINIYYQKKVGINIIKFWKEIIKITVPNIIPIAIILIIMHLIPLHGYYNVMVFGGIYTILYCITCYFISMNDYEKDIINKMLIKLKVKRENNERNCIKK